ncbi:MAG: hypothetical protein C4336_09895 [Armatimonadota bacterium]
MVAATFHVAHSHHHTENIRVTDAPSLWMLKMFAAVRMSNSLFNKPITKGTTMTPQEVVRKAMEAFNQHDAETYASLYAANAVAHDPQYFEPLRGRESIRKDIEDFFLAFPDVQAKIISTIHSADSVAFEVEVSGTHKGPLVTPNGSIPATNRPMTMLGGRFIRVDSQWAITECNRYFDMAVIAQQLGLS